MNRAASTVMTAAPSVYHCMGGTGLGVAITTRLPFPSGLTPSVLTPPVHTIRMPDSLWWGFLLTVSETISHISALLFRRESPILTADCSSRSRWSSRRNGLLL